MTAAADLRSGKTHRDENFPVASHLIHKRHRGTILAFYRFARAADDVADHPTLDSDAKLALLDRLEATLLGADDSEADALLLRAALADRGLPPRHAQDLLKAFRMDVIKRRYRTWDDLMDYCAYSAMPVGRFVLDVHGESHVAWPASDPLCAALQVINHLQDCGADFRRLDRIYIPMDVLAVAGLDPEVLGCERAPRALRHSISGLIERTAVLLRAAEPLPTLVNDTRLGLEIAVILQLAWTLSGRLMRRDPLSERVHLTAPGFTGVALLGMAQGICRLLARRLGGGRSRRTEA